MSDGNGSVTSGILVSEVLVLNPTKVIHILSFLMILFVNTNAKNNHFIILKQLMESIYNFSNSILLLVINPIFAGLHFFISLQLKKQILVYEIAQAFRKENMHIRFEENWTKNVTACLVSFHSLMYSYCCFSGFDRIGFNSQLMQSNPQRQMNIHTYCNICFCK